MDDTPRSRRDLIRTALLGAGFLALPPVGRLLTAQPPAAKGTRPTTGKGSPAQPMMTVYKDPNCGCCKLWVDHVRAAGFAVTVRDTADMGAVKASFGVPESLHSCHTAKIGPYTIEGHVPAEVISRLLTEQPAGRGLAVPGMPVGSPGMEMGDRKDPYDIVLFDKAGKTRVYARR